MRRTKCVSAIAGIVPVRYGAAVVGIALLLVAALNGIPRDAQAKQPGYTFKAIAFLSDPAPKGGTFVNDFEPGGLNSQGDMAFGADVSTGGEGVFLRHKGQITELGRSFESAPGGVTFDFGFLGPVGLNDQGDMVFDFLLTPFTRPPPVGVNAGAYRYSHTTHKVTPVVIPLVTPAPGFSGSFQGVLPADDQQPRRRGVPGHRGDRPWRARPRRNLPWRGDRRLPGGRQGPHCQGRRSGRHGARRWQIRLRSRAVGQRRRRCVLHRSHRRRESAVEGFPPQDQFISALGGLYVKQGGTGKILTIVHSSSEPGTKSEFRQVLHDVMNSRGDIVFFGDVTPLPNNNQNIAVFLYSGGKIRRLPGPAIPCLAAETSLTPASWAETTTSMTAATSSLAACWTPAWRLTASSFLTLASTSGRTVSSA